VFFRISSPAIRMAECCQRSHDLTADVLHSGSVIVEFLENVVRTFSLRLGLLQVLLKPFLHVMIAIASFSSACRGSCRPPFRHVKPSVPGGQLCTELYRR
jgi:hypothetical protein